MKFKLDENLPVSSTAILASAGHDVDTDLDRVRAAITTMWAMSPAAGPMSCPRWYAGRGEHYLASLAYGHPAGPMS